MSSPLSAPQPPAADGSRRRDRPYVGPRTFEEKEADRFFGRDREARDLLALVVRERLVLFYAQSGAGKSSLLNTRLIPDLRAQGFEILPVGRVSGVVPAAVDPAHLDNIFIYNLILSLNQSLPEAARVPAPALAATTLLTYLGGEELAQAEEDDALAESDAGAELVATVLVIDQFEELVTTNLDHWQEREGFFRQLSAVLNRLPNLWVVLTLREDYVARLDPYAELLPNRMRARFYMERMGVPAALEAVTRPAAAYNHPFAPGVAETLVDNLRRVRVHSEDEPRLGQYVEPVQLQVVCFQLWEQLNGPGGRWRTAADAASQIITESDLPLDYIDQALTRFYEDALHDVLSQSAVQAAGVNERLLRDWFSRQLITDAGIRNSLLRNEETRRTGGLPNVAVDRLARHYLVRTELRAGGAWVELVHDRFVEPILEANGEWLLRQSPLLRTAQEWQDSGRQPERLLLAPQLAVLAGEIAGARQDPLIAAFVSASEAAAAAAAKAEADRQAALLREQELKSSRELLAMEAKRATEQEATARRLRQQLGVIIFVGFLAVVAAIVAGVAGFLAYQLRNDALAQEATALTQEATARAALAVALVEKSTAQAAQAAAVAQSTTAAAAQQTSDAQRLIAEAAQQSAFELANSLAAVLTASAPTPTSPPTETPTPPPPDAPPFTPTAAGELPFRLPSPTQEPVINYDATATVDAIQVQLAQAQATQTAVAVALPASQLADSSLAVGDLAQLGPDLNATVRTQPGSGAGEVVSYLSGGDIVLIIDGPILLPGESDTIVWWKVRLSDGSEGWTPANTSQFTLLSRVTAARLQQLDPSQLLLLTPAATGQQLPLDPRQQLLLTPIPDLQQVPLDTGQAPASQLLPIIGTPALPGTPPPPLPFPLPAE